MVIINAVGCTHEEVFKVFMTYYEEMNNKAVLLTDDDLMAFYITRHKRGVKSVYNETLTALWMKVTDDSILIITNIDNVVCALYKDIEESYPVIHIEAVEGASI